MPDEDSKPLIEFAAGRLPPNCSYPGQFVAIIRFAALKGELQRFIQSDENDCDPQVPADLSMFHFETSPTVRTSGSSLSILELMLFYGTLSPDLLSLMHISFGTSLKKLSNFLEDKEKMLLVPFMKEKDVLKLQHFIGRLSSCGGLGTMCSEKGTLACTACSSISYCSHKCQKVS